MGIVATLLTAWLLRGRETPTARVRVDRVGIGLLAIGVGSLQVMLDRGKDLDWFGAPAIVALAVGACVALAFFVAWELTDEQPAVDLRLFAGRNFTAGTVALCLAYAVYFGNIVLLPLWLQTQMAYTATWAGLATAPVGALPIVLAPFVGRHMHRVDLRWLATASLVAFAATSFWYAGFNTQVTFSELAWSRFAQGLGLALFFPPLLTIVLSGLPASRVASAAGLANTLRTLAGSFATSLTDDVVGPARSAPSDASHRARDRPRPDRAGRARSAAGARRAGDAGLRRARADDRPAGVHAGDERSLLAVGLDLPRPDRGDVARAAAVHRRRRIRGRRMMGERRARPAARGGSCRDEVGGASFHA